MYWVGSCDCGENDCGDCNDNEPIKINEINISVKMEKTMEQKKVSLNVTKLKAGQHIETKNGGFTVEKDETSIYIPEDIVLKKGDKLYLNPIAEEQRKYNQTHYVTIFRKNK